MDLVEELKKKIREKEIKRVQMRKEKGKEKALNPKADVFKRSGLPGKYKAKILFGWDNGRFEHKYLKKLERSWARWKEKWRQVPPKVKL